jgi:hypothetical protein
MKLTFERAQAEHALGLAARLRWEDWREVEEGTGLPCPVALRQSIRLSAESWVARLPDGTPVAVFGVARDVARDGGVVWMLCTRAVERCPLVVLKEARRFIARWLREYRYLHNAADYRNALHIRWVQQLGFTLGHLVERRGLPFQTFHLDSEATHV